jgi:two-component system, OmpR family, sensor histidine kinase KdpD
MNDEQRPDPDELLSRIAAEETEAKKQDSARGKLKIFFGACAGVGKTYAMLSGGMQALTEGTDVVIGLVETHGREETKKLLEGIPILPNREVQYRGTLIKEFDIDAALARKPQLILLDELAHTNAPGSRHPKRWNDVEELLAAGINVYTTINVQHLESLNDVVARITGVWVKETVPDAMFDNADEISLVDIPSEELLKRLKEGKVYIAPEAKKRAAQNFFKKSNLIALRELALRRTAERVDALMDVYKSKSGGAQGWSGADRILVCIGSDVVSSKLVRVAKRMAGGLKSPWTALYVENDRHYRLSKEGHEAVERTLRLAERMGGKTEIVQGQKASADILNYARSNGITKIIVGKTPKPRWREILYGTLADQLIRGSGDIDVYVVTGSEMEERQSPRLPLLHSHATWQSYGYAALTIVGCTAFIMAIRPFVDVASMVMLYLICVVGVALRYGRGPSIVATLTAVFSVNFFFIPPYYVLKISENQHMITFLSLLVTGLVIGTQTARLRVQAMYARKREKHTATLYGMSREMTANRGKVTLAQIAAQHVADVLDSDVFIWLPDAAGQLQTLVAETESEKQDVDPVREESVARWAFTHKQNAGLGTDTLPGSKALYVPLVGSGGVVGVLGVTPHEEIEAYTSEQMDLLETFASIVASALERASAAELMEKTLVEAESEKLRNILLSSVSHDLRTPLAAITGAVSTLLIEGEKMNDAQRKELLKAVHEESARLARMVTNLLDVSSLESGAVKLNKELYFIEELIGSALMRVENALADHKVVTHIEHGLPLLRMDGLLIEQVMINLLENAANYTPPGTTVTISAAAEKPDIRVVVTDNGPGIPQGDEERIFDKFYAGAGRSESGGGLGLAICRGIIHAHGGKIWAQNAPEGGAILTFTLPIRSQEGE